MFSFHPEYLTAQDSVDRASRPTAEPETQSCTPKPETPSFVRHPGIQTVARNTDGLKGEVEEMASNTCMKLQGTRR